jgi:uncharacterized protein
MLSKKHLLIKRSGIPKAGKGLFTKIDIPKGMRIIEYKGKITTWKEALQSKVFNAYVFYLNRNHVIDAKYNLKSFGRYANDANGLSKIKGLVNNSKYVIDNGCVFLQSIRNIPAGTEILVGYKKEYWDVIKYNSLLRLNQKKHSGKK